MENDFAIQERILAVLSGYIPKCKAIEVNVVV